MSRTYTAEDVERLMKGLPLRAEPDKLKEGDFFGVARLDRNPDPGKSGVFLLLGKGYGVTHHLDVSDIVACEKVRAILNHSLKLVDIREKDLHKERRLS